MAEQGLDVEALRRDRGRYRDLLAQAEEQVDAWTRWAESVRYAIDGIDQLVTLAAHAPPVVLNGQTTTAAPSTETGPAADAPKGTDAVRAVLADDPGRALTIAELVAELQRRGWLAPSKRPEELVRINLKRLAERGGAERTADGRWRATGASSTEEQPLNDDPPQPEPEPAAPPPPAQVYAGSTTGRQPPSPTVGSVVQEW